MTLSRPVALTMGEPAGIGGELTLKAWATRRSDSPSFVAIDSADRLRRLAAEIGLAVEVRKIDDPRDADRIFANALPVYDLGPVTASPGEPSTATARHVLEAIETAVALAAAGDVAAIVTNPIQKSTLYAAGFKFPGHTEYLASLARPVSTPVMMLCCEGLRVVPVTIHISLRDALAALSSDLIVEQGSITAAALRTDFDIAGPRLAIAGLNPHAGENGAMGDEERTIIEPAIERLRANGIDARGPYPPDTLFTAPMRETYDAALCMYHDQALIPIKTLAFDTGVNVTLGLSFIRTSPDHGTALDIAGKGIAGETSLVAAIQLAASLAANRRRHLRDT